MATRKARTWACTSVFTVALALLVTPAAQASDHSPLPFKPGHYGGFTSQTCPIEPLPAGACKPGERLPISFTAGRKSVSHLKVVVAEQCESGETAIHTISEGSSGEQNFAIKKRQTVFEYIGPRTSAGRDSAWVFLHGHAAHGFLLSSLTVDSAGQPDSQPGDQWCGSPEPSVTWRAKRARPPHAAPMTAKAQAAANLDERREKRAHTPPTPSCPPGHKVCLTVGEPPALGIYRFSKGTVDPDQSHAGRLTVRKASAGYAIADFRIWLGNKEGCSLNGSLATVEGVFPLVEKIKYLPLGSGKAEKSLSWRLPHRSVQVKVGGQVYPGNFSAALLSALPGSGVEGHLTVTPQEGAVCGGYFVGRHGRKS